MLSGTGTCFSLVSAVVFETSLSELATNTIEYEDLLPVHDHTCACR